MATFFDNNAHSLRTATLIQDLDGAQRVLEALSASNSEVEATELLEQTKDLISIVDSINEFSIKRRRNAFQSSERLSAADGVHLSPVLQGICNTVEDSTVFVKVLESSLESLAHARSTVGYLRSDTQLANQHWYRGTSKVLRLQTEVLRLLFSAVNLLHHKHKTDEDGTLSATAHNYASNLHYQITTVEPKLQAAIDYDTTILRNAVTAARAVEIHVPASTNKHFLVERSAKTFYTGRERQMAKLRAGFEDTTHVGQQRMIIYGLAGSGKTELAIKYAEECQNRFWGVFFVDGSSRENASGSYAAIATVGGVEPNEKAAKNWLATRDLPWLLIVDNVDDEEIHLDELLPSGTKGTILITSRNPAHKSYGNVGHRFVELRAMEKEEAHELILKAAEEPSPWAKTVKDCASKICQALGFLPLALVHAAKAILTGHCTWPGYLSYYDRQVQVIRRSNSQRRGRNFSGNRGRMAEDDDSMNVFSSYEILYQSLQSSQDERYKDAVELLHVFSFFHFQNIRLDIFINAATFPFKEAEQQRKDTEEEGRLRKKGSKWKAKSWSMWLREARYATSRYFDPPPPLPTVLKNLRCLPQSVFEAELPDRLTRAVAVLIKRSLVTRQDRIAHRYSMHPLVHKWVRERPEMLIAHQSVWCQISVTTLAKSILRPPQDDTEEGKREEGRKSRRELLPHIHHVRDCQLVIKGRLEEFKGIKTVNQPKYGRLQADEDIRFSRVFSEYGLFDDALELQLRVRAFIMEMLAEDHPIFIMVTLFASGTLWELSRTGEATEFQRRALQNCLQSLGDHHPLTLQVTDSLGNALLVKGRYAEAFGLLKNNVEDTRNLYGEYHEKTYLALRNLGRAHVRKMEYEEATRLHMLAWDGMKALYSETHLETLICLEDLAMSYLRHDGVFYPEQEADLLESHEKMTFVYTNRKEILGREQPYTILAYFHLAQVTAAIGRLEEAEKMMLEAMATAAISISDEHTAVLAGKLHYARLLVQLERYKEGSDIMTSLIDKPQYRKASDGDGEHPDRIAALWFLADCQERQGKFGDALATCEEAWAALQAIGGEGQGLNHKFRLMVTTKISELRDKGNEVTERVDSGLT